jgi:hypothetical protein
MRRIAPAIALVAALIAPAFAQKAEIEAVNAKWTFPPGSSMVKGRAAIEALWKSMAAQVSDPKLTTLDVKPLGPSAARAPINSHSEIGNVLQLSGCSNAAKGILGG